MYTFLFKTTNNCNLRCRYCFINNSNKANRMLMSIDSAKLAFQKIYDFIKYRGDNTCRILWHGGEPLLWGVDNYRELFEYLIIAFPNFQFTHCMQSNITLLTKEYLGLFSKYKCDISTSIDGYKELHDINRLKKNGYGSFDSVKRKLILANSMGAHIGAVVVVSKSNINYLREIYNFFKDINVGFRLNPISLIGEANGNDALGVTPEQFANELIDLFDYWIDDNNAVSITNFVEIASNLKTGITYSCDLSPNCQENLTTIEPNGDVTPCDRFTGISKFVYGNIFKDSLFDIMHRKCLDFRTRTIEIQNKECMGCDIWNICRGGCPASAFSNTGTIMHKGSECIAYKQLVYHVRQRLSL